MSQVSDSVQGCEIWIGESGQEEQYRGVVWLEEAFMGSKSAKDQPYLLMDTQALPIFKMADNPFQNDALLPFLGKEVLISGKWLRGIFVIVEIVEVVELSADNEADSEDAQDTESNPKTDIS